ncbi:hypothetical protein [Devosia sp. CN2-171]|uniref:hypothetical protein n=1 Tax=Devosia sp. CN2-171 TaxID=3400909 RepID=UPI003BF7C4F0
MKLTWFGGTTIRIHIGGSILVCDPAGIGGVDPDELVSGADRVFSMGELDRVDAATWQPGRAGSMLDEVGEVSVHGIEGGAIVAAPGEPPLVLTTATPPRLGRWGRDSVVVAFGDVADQLAADVLDAVGPKLIAVAAPERVVDKTFSALRNRLNGTGLTSLEVGLALEI